MCHGFCPLPECVVACRATSSSPALRSTSRTWLLFFPLRSAQCARSLRECHMCMPARDRQCETSFLREIKDRVYQRVRGPRHQLVNSFPGVDLQEGEIVY